MTGAFDSRKTDAPAPLLILAAAVLIAAGVGASVWTLWQSLRAAPAIAPPADAPADLSPPPPPTAAGASAPAAAPLRGGEFVTDFEQMRRRAAAGQATAAVLRREQKAGAGSPWSEDQIKAVERGDLAIR